MATPQPINVDCEEYGVRAIQYSPTDRSDAEVERLEQKLTQAGRNIGELYSV